MAEDGEAYGQCGTTGAGRMAEAAGVKNSSSSTWDRTFHNTAP